MRVEHPLWRGFFLAVMLTFARVLLGAAVALSMKSRLLLAAGLLVGALVASVPGMLRKGREKPQKITWQRCLVCLLCGTAMGVSLRLAGGWALLMSLPEGSVGAMAFAGMAMLTGFVTCRIAGRREAA